MNINKQELYDFFDTYLSALTSMLNAEEQKLDAIYSNDMEQLNKAMNISQANAMQIENLEKKREVLQAEAGLSNYNFSQIIEDADEKNKAKLKQIFSKAEKTISQIQYLNTRSMRIADSNLRLMGIAPETYLHETTPNYPNSKPKEAMNILNAKKGYNVK